MTLIAGDYWSMLAGCLVAIPCAILGCYLVLRRMVMIGDAISHAVLPGIVLAFMLTDKMDTLPLLIGAGSLGMLTTFLIEFLHRKVRLQEDASIGVTFTWLFAIGVILVSTFVSNVHIDQECVLYGDLVNIPFDLMEIGGKEMGPVAIWTLGLVNLCVLAFVWIFYRQLFITTFDPSFAVAIGISATLWHYALMGAVSMVSVASFESVGAILVVAFLVAPAATAYLLTDNFKLMLGLSVLFGIASAILGYLLAISLNSSAAGGMVTVAGGIFGLVFVLSPRYGMFSKKLRTLFKVA